MPDKDDIRPISDLMNRERGWLLKDIDPSLMHGEDDIRPISDLMNRKCGWLWEEIDPSPNYAQLEQHIIGVMNNYTLFTCGGKEYKVLTAGKPRPQGSGECKTDVYIELLDVRKKEKREIKISVKTEGLQEFQENKITAERAKAILGPSWQNVIYQTTQKIKNRFENKCLLYEKSCGKIKPNSITLGWRLEITTKPRDLSAKVDLSDREIRDYIYKGTNLPEEKKNALVNGKVVRNSGVAEYLLATTIDQIRSPQDVLSQMKPIDKMVVGDTYMVFTANNYRMEENSADGPRPLAARVEWQVIGLFKKKLRANLCFDTPLSFTGEGDMLPKLQKALKTFGATSVRDLLPYLEDPSIYYPPLGQ